MAPFSSSATPRPNTVSIETETPVKNRKANKYDNRPCCGEAKPSSRQASKEKTPIDSAIHATYTGKNQQLALAQSYLRTPQTNLTMNGTISKRSSLAVRLDARDLREVATIAGLFSAPKPGTAQQPASAQPR